jgi:predicted ATPase/DNA-binding SARP family transcriptional activator
MMPAAPMLRVQLFGRPRLEYACAPLALRAPPRTLALLIYLLLAGPPEREAIAFTFWPDLPESEARAKLREYLRCLRAALPQHGAVPWLLTDKRALRWNPDAAAWIDVAEYDRLSGDAASAAAAVELYAGDLAGTVDEEWLTELREKFRQRQTALLLQLIAKSRAEADQHATIEFAERLLQHDPWHEDAVRTLVAIRHECGDRAGALRTYRDFAQRLNAEFGVGPMPETTAVYEVVRAASAPRASTTPRHNLTEPLMTFIGREEDVASLSALVVKRRHVTLTGAGGVGKTRLAIETARNVLDRFPDGVWFAELASVSDPDLVASTVAASMNVQEVTAASLFATLRGKHLLLVLDNCEHLIAAAAIFVERLLKECPHVHVLSTSREPLRVSGERTERVASLAVPNVDASRTLSLEELCAVPAIQLFLERAADVVPITGLPADDAVQRHALITISRRLDGIPLAIELAAAWTSSISLEELAERLNDRFSILTRGRRTALPRQQTLRATLDWSYELLAPDEQTLLQRVSIFAGGWTLEAATLVCGNGQDEQSSVIETLSSLVDKSLVVVEVKKPSTRYHLLETTRAYALEKLGRDDARQTLARRHATYYANLAQRNDTTWGAAASLAAVETLTPELDNMRAVLQWSVDAAKDPGLGASLVGALRWFFAACYLNGEGVRWCERALAALGSRPERRHEALVQLALAGSMGSSPFFPRFSYYRARDADRFRVAAERAAMLLTSPGEEADRALALALAAMHWCLLNANAKALHAASDAVAAARESGKRTAVGIALYAKSFAVDQRSLDDRRLLLLEALEYCPMSSTVYNRAVVMHALGELAFEGGDPALALEYARQSANTLASPADLLNRAQVDVIVAAYALALGRLDEAVAALRIAFTIARWTGDAMVAAAAFQHLAGVAATRGDADSGARFLGVSDARRGGDHPRLYTEQTGYDRTLLKLRETLNAPQLAALMHEGYEWNVDRAFDAAMTLV